MSNDREKLLKIMSSLESDYRAGKISAEKYEDKIIVSPWSCIFS